MLYHRIECLLTHKKLEQRYNNKQKNENRYAKRIYVYVHIRFRRRSRKNKKYWSIKGYGLFMFSPCSSSHSRLSTVYTYTHILLAIYYGLIWVKFSIKKKLFEDKWVNNINKVYEISRYFKFFCFFLFNKSKTLERFFSLFIYYYFKGEHWRIR